MRHSHILIALSLSFIAAEAFAGAWTQDEGKGLVILTADYYNAEKLWNNAGKNQSQPTYSKEELDPYLEYGLMNGLTIGTNLSLQRAHQNGNPDQTNWGVGDSQFFARARLWQQDGFVLSAEPMFKLPSPENSTDTPKLGGSHPDIGMGLSGGYGFSTGGLNHFIDIDTSYRHRFGSPKDQVLVSGTLGWSISPQWMIMPQVFTTWRTSSPTVATFTESSADDYNLVALQLTAVYKINNDTSFQFGGFDDVDGKNTGQGRGVLVALWKHF